MADVTVVMATRDRRDAVLSTLARLHALPERPPVVLVDNASADGTPDAVEQQFPDVSVVRSGRNRGAAGRTLGVALARTELVAFADDDSWWAPGALARATQVFAAHPRLGLLAARVLVGADQRLDPLCALLAASPLGTEPDLPGPSVLGFLSCGAVVRRDAYLQVGGFSGVVFFLGEETLLAQDFAAAGWGVAYVDDVVAHHHPGLTADRAGRTRLQARNALLSTWLRRPLGVCAVETVRTGRRSPRALYDAARQLPLVLLSRRALPEAVEQQVRRLG